VGRLRRCALGRKELRAKQGDAKGMEREIGGRGDLRARKYAAKAAPPIRASGSAGNCEAGAPDVAGAFDALDAPV
jgi:hypothetical protein